jgi:putative transposase
MPDHHRNRVPGGPFFFTVNLLDPRSDLSLAQIDILREAVARMRANAPLRIDAWLVLPDYMHCLWTLPHGDADFPGGGAQSKSRLRNVYRPASPNHRS